ncbi:DGQHR domain-containing protein [Pararhizobium polonicum]|uniref:DGQHR domain-containing protein n=1 Tax=Pararhizobium polonicum TaxID=1612624 RepID=UPI0013149F17|nr:DGQHR domain-containing protein [Pararhizobium polonicum]
MNQYISDKIEAVITQPDAVFNPLLRLETDLRAEAKRRKPPLNFKTVRPEDVAEELGNGWAVKKAGKRQTTLGRPKQHDQLLEDRIWSLLRMMGYQQMNGHRSTIEFKRTDGSIGRKQIDVFAADAETAIVAECKSRETRGRKSLQKDLQDTILLQEYIRKLIYSSYPNTAKPKIIWLYATNNIIWSESDLERAEDGKITVTTENEIQYFEAFLKHMGPAGKYQILGEFLKGQKVPGLEGVKIPAIKGRIAGETFFSFVVTPRNLLRIAFVNHQALNHPDGKPAYQRMISSSRIKEIGEFIKQGGFFPTNILVNFTSPPRFDPISNKENTDDNIKFGWLTLPQLYRSAWIIDGQHRLYGYSSITDKFLDQSLFVLAFNGMDTHKEADLFITINHKQKSVPKSLLVSLLADLRLGDSDARTATSALASAVVRAINTDKTSPLSRRFITHGVPPEANQNLTVSEAVNGLVRSELIGRVIGKGRLGGPLSGPTDEATITRAKIVLNAYFEELRKTNPERWEAGRTGYISTNPGIRAHLGLIAEVVKYLSQKTGQDFHAIQEKEFAACVVDFTKPLFDHFSSADDDAISQKFSRKFGEGGVKEYLYHLLKVIHDVHPDFGPQEFITWISQRESARVDEANAFVMNLSERLTNYVIETLKSIHGTHILPSGDAAFWEVGVESRRVKDNAYRKQQEDKQERRKPREAYFDLIDLEEIVKQKNNWDHFEYIFNMPMEDEKKGKKYYLDWISRYNELRRVAAHKNNMRTYTEEDIEFLDWLRSELTPKLKSIS